jgi:hypothetical protein
MAAQGAAPRPRSTARLREAPFGAPEACVAGAVLCFVACIGVWILPDHEGSWRHEPTGVTEAARSFAVTALYLVEVALLVVAWRGRRPRMVVGPSVRGSEGPALATAALGVASLLLIPGWLGVARDGRRDAAEFLLLAVLALLGFLLLRLGSAHLRRARASVLASIGPLLPSAPNVPGQAAVAVPESAFEALRDRPPPGYSFAASRSRPSLPTPSPVGFSLTRVQDGALTPPTFGLLLLAAAGTAVAVPALAAVARSLFGAA